MIWREVAAAAQSRVDVSEIETIKVEKGAYR